MGFFSDPLEGNCYTNLGLEWNICVCQSKLLAPRPLPQKRFSETNQVLITVLSWLDNVPDELSLLLHN